MWSGLAAALPFVLGAPTDAPATNYSVLKSILVDAEIDSSVPSITVRWPLRTDILDYTLTRVDEDGSEAFSTTLAGDSTGYIDSSINTGEIFEYRVRASTTSYRVANGVVAAAIDLPAVEERGSVLLVIEESVSRSLSREFNQLRLDLCGDGWEVSQESVRADETPHSVRARIIQWADPRQAAVDRAVFLIGRVPVAESGYFAPDGHTNHLGPWPSDGYYGEVDGNWETTTAPFTPSYFPSDVDLMVGRVDLAGMPAFADDESGLLRKYFSRLHQFRHREITAPLRARIHDRINYLSEGPSANARSGFSAIGGRGNLESGALFPAISSNSYLLGHACGTANYTALYGIGSTTNFSQSPSNVVFLTLFGSYFGDWPTTDNLLRAPLGADGLTLATGYSGRPQWNVHHLGLGFPLGFAARLSQNMRSNLPYHTSYYAKGVHTSLMGDPTLHLFPAKPPGEASATRSTNTPTEVLLGWSDAGNSSSPDFLGYHVFRAASSSEGFTRITTGPIFSTGWTDSAAPVTESVVYLVRALWRVRTGSGTFLQLSQGRFAWPHPEEKWRQEQFGIEATEEAVAGPLADPDEDRRTNLVEYAQLTPPRSNAAAGTVPSSIHRSSTGDSLVFSYHRNAEATDLAFIPEISIEGRPWAPINEPPRLASDPGENPEVWEVALPSETEACIHARLRIERRFPD
ncbi:MAG: hypothetical protein AAGJ79_01350 [Verrucomicrobiota bacterium]